MFASFRRSKPSRHSETTPLLAALNQYRGRQNAAPSDHDNRHPDHVAYYEDEDHHPCQRQGSLLPVFSAEVLDRIPIYNATHAIRAVLVQRCETTLSWEQLRSPQVSQFLVKPAQQQIQSEHFSRGVLYCLLANCLQFRKEAEEHPGNAGVCRTRALIAELLAMRLLKELSTRELIDALAYDFDPLRGLAAPAPGMYTPGGLDRLRSSHATRISTLEIAIRAQAKKFLAHPLVVRQLEAIWAGTIVFHSAADSLHRTPDSIHPSRTTNSGNTSPGPASSRRPGAAKRSAPLPTSTLMRRTVTLYDPHNASLFKLSRLRVPRYRNIFSTMSFGVMLALFLAVLTEKSDDITGLEIIFWFWSAGYMLDEVVGFSEQGFGLYIMSVWNAFDLGILLMFMAYYILRLYGILMPDISRHRTAAMAYDVLASTAVLLFPRLFSSLDHNRYFSQLLIAFRMMAMDLVAILVLIIISCSGFFIAFTMAFKRDLGASDAAYSIFQLVMGFTPAAWDLWGEVNVLGKALLALFLFICHFLIVTILITVLTNSFMAVVKNGEEEHQFLFAVNTISMVKSDALFSYIPPTNIIGWLFIPLKYVMPFRLYLRANRLIVKLTHIPILFSIFLYERVVLSHLAYGPADLVEDRGRQGSKAPLPAFTLGMRAPTDMFSPRLREPSVTTFYKDRALEEVFRRPYCDSSVQGPWPNLDCRRSSGGMVNDWMKKMGDDDANIPPLEDTRSVLDRLETRKRPYVRRSKTVVQPRRRHPLAVSKTIASDPEENAFSHGPIAEEDETGAEDAPHQTDADADGDDEDEPAPLSNRNTIGISSTMDGVHNGVGSSEEEPFRTPMTTLTKSKIHLRKMPDASSSSSSREETQISPTKGPARFKPSHGRNLSTSTVLYSPTKSESDVFHSTSAEKHSKAASRGASAIGTTVSAQLDGSTASAGRPSVHTTSLGTTSRPRPIVPSRDTPRQQLPNMASLLAMERTQREPSFNAIALDLASDLGDNNLNPNFGNSNTLPPSFTTQFQLAARMKARDQNSDGESDSNRMSRIMLARMTTLEEGFRDMLKEVKGLKTDGQLTSRGACTPPNEVLKRKAKAKKRARRGSEEERMGSSL